MGHLHDPNDPRHARLFELLRQRELAHSTTVRISNRPVPPQAAAVVADVQARALRSFQSMNMDTAPVRKRRRVSGILR